MQKWHLPPWVVGLNEIMPSECLGRSLTPAVLCSGRQLSYLCCCPICNPLPLPPTHLPHEEKTPPAPPEASSPLAERQPHPSGQTLSWELSFTPLSHPTPNPLTGRQLRLQILARSHTFPLWSGGCLLLQMDGRQPGLAAPALTPCSVQRPGHLVSPKLHRALPLL